LQVFYGVGGGRGGVRGGGGEGGKKRQTSFRRFLFEMSTTAREINDRYVMFSAVYYSWPIRFCGSRMPVWNEAGNACVRTSNNTYSVR
jgi:hypothetical protein